VGVGGQMAIIHTQVKEVNDVFCNPKKHEEFKIQGFGCK